MSRVTLLRQTLADYNKKVQSADSMYREQYSAYGAKIDDYNNFLNSVKAGQQQAVGEFSPGLYTVLKGYSDDKGEVGLTAAYADKQGNPQMSGALVSELPKDNADGAAGVYLKNADGTATFHTWDSGQNYVAGSGGDGGSDGQVVQDGTPGWVASGNTLRVMNPDTIIAPEQMKLQAPSLTLGDMEELQNPTDDQAGIAKANALGYSGNSKLVADEPTSRNSAFFNIAGDDPNGLKDKGILARTLAGEL